MASPEWKQSNAYKNNRQRGKHRAAAAVSSIGAGASAGGALYSRRQAVAHTTSAMDAAESATRARDSVRPDVFYAQQHKNFARKLDAEGNPNARAWHDVSDTHLKRATANREYAEQANLKAVKHLKSAKNYKIGAVAGLVGAGVLGANAIHQGNKVGEVRSKQLARDKVVKNHYNINKTRDRKRGASTGGAIGAGVGASTGTGAAYGLGRLAHGVKEADAGNKAKGLQVRNSYRMLRAGTSAKFAGAVGLAGAGIGAGAGAAIGRKKKVVKSYSGVSAFGVDHGDISKALTPRQIGTGIGLAAGGAVTGGIGAAAGGYGSGRIGRSNRKQTKKMGHVGGAISGAGVGLLTHGPVGALAGAGAGGYLGGVAAHRGATTRIANRKRNEGQRLASLRNED